MADGMPVVGPTALPPSDVQLPAPGGAVDFNVMLVQVATDFSKFDPVPHQTTLHLVNNFVLQTTRFLNRFSNTCEEKLAELSSDIQSLEISLSIVEAKLDIQGLDMSAPPPSSAPAAPAAAESAPPPTKAPLEPEPEPEPDAQPAGVKVKDHARCAPLSFFQLRFGTGCLTAALCAPVLQLQALRQDAGPRRAFAGGQEQNAGRGAAARP